MDVEELKTQIDKKGLKIRYLADRLGISHEAMYNKVKGRTEFKASEIALLIDILGIEDSEIIPIFFTPRVQSN